MMHFALALALLHTASAWSPLLFLRGDPIPQELRLDWEGMTSKKEAFERRSFPATFTLPSIIRKTPTSLSLSGLEKDRSSQSGGSFYVPSTFLTSSYDVYVASTSSLTTSSLTLPPNATIRVDGDLTMAAGCLSSASGVNVIVNGRMTLQAPPPSGCLGDVVVHGVLEGSAGLVECEYAKVGKSGVVIGGLVCKEAEVEEGGKVDGLVILGSYNWRSTANITNQILEAYDSFGNPLVSTPILRQQPGPPATAKWMPPSSSSALTPDPVPPPVSTPTFSPPTEKSPMLLRGPVTLKDAFDNPLIGSASESAVARLRANKSMLLEDRAMMDAFLGKGKRRPEGVREVGVVDNEVGAGRGSYEPYKAVQITKDILGRGRKDDEGTSGGAKDEVREVLKEEAKEIVKKNNRFMRKW